MKELKQSAETIKLALTSAPNQESIFLTTTLHNQAPKQIQEAENYCDVVPRIKNLLFDEALGSFLSN